MNNTNKFICNAFSLQMVSPEDLPRVRFESIEAPTADQLQNATSAVGHQDTASVLGVEYNRMNVRLYPGVELFVAQLNGGRLPEGATTLPEGFSFSWVRVYLVE